MAAILLFICVCLGIMSGYPVALTLAGVSLIGAGIGIATGALDAVFLHALPGRIFGIINNPILIAVPLFVFMGTVLERSKLAENLFIDVGSLFRRLPGGGALAVLAIGVLLAASTGIIGATVVTMGLLALPSLLRQGYHPSLASGAICAVGTLGQLIPPSIALLLLGDVLGSAYQHAQIQQGIFSPKTVSIGELFAGAIIPGLILVALYAAYIIARAHLSPAVAPAAFGASRRLVRLSRLLPPISLIVIVLGSILFGVATPTEAAGVGAVGAMLLAAAKRQLSREVLRDVTRSTLEVSAMVFLILIGATVFSLVFRGFGGDDLVHRFFEQLPGGRVAAVALVMLVIFLLGFILDFIEISYVVVPIVAPPLFIAGFDPVWLGIMIAINLQTSFLTPPFGFALFYLRGVAPPQVATTDIYKGVAPFIALQLLLLLILFLWPSLATWLPAALH